MGHDATKIQLGTVRKSFKTVDNQVGTVAAGLICRQKSDGTVTTAKADGEALGISLGGDLSGAGSIAICRQGLGVPVKLTAAFDISSLLGKQVHISDTTGMAIASGAGATGMNAIYASGALTGVKEDGTIDGDNSYALIDFQGGL